MKFSLVTTVLNDKAGCQEFFDRMANQTRRPDELVIVDGGSHDGTWDFLQTFRFENGIKLIAIQETGCNVARGRNIAIENSSNSIIASTDVGCRWAVDWLENLVKPFESDADLDAVLGSWNVVLASLQCPWAQIEFAMQHGFEFIATPNSHASSRSIAYKKSLWQELGGYPEDLTLAGDDSAYAVMLHNSTKNVAADPIPRVEWQRLNGLKAFRREARRNFLGIGEAMLFPDFGQRVVPFFLFEVLCATAFLVAFILYLANTINGLTFAIIVFACFLGWSRRVVRWVVISKELAQIGHLSLIWRVPIFEFSLRAQSVIGYLIGRKRGATNCLACRERLWGGEH